MKKKAAVKKSSKKTGRRRASSPAKKSASRSATASSGLRGLFRSFRATRWLIASCFVFLLVYLAYLDVKIVDRFEGRIWQLPAKVYARSLELYEGKTIDAQQIEFELKLLGYTATDSMPAHSGQFFRWRNHYDIYLRAHQYLDTAEPSRLVRITLSDKTVSSITDINTGEDIAISRFEPAYIDGVFPQHGEDRILVSFDEVPDAFIKILVLTEDRRFFEHIGIDFYAIARAMVANIKAGRTVQGGSTLTQQLVKNLYLSSERSLIRKINEAFMSLLLELHYDKKTILETYLNEIYLGQDRNRAIHGFGLASEFYFSKPLARLDYDQLALLVGMVKGASYYNPARHKQRAKQRRDTVLNSMRLENLISDAQYQRLIRKDIVVTRHEKRSKYPAFIDLVKRQLAASYDEDDLSAEGLNIYTTLDPYVQYQAEQAVTDTLASYFSNKPKLQVASVIASHSSGDVLAVVGDRHPKYPGFNRALDVRRQIGSLIKPVVYLAALSDSQNYTFATLLDDSPISLTNELGAVWTPQNYDRKSHGQVMLFDALMKSYNIPAVKTGLDVGLGVISKTWQALGAERALRALPSITLGAIDSSPIEMTGIYQTLAADGFNSPLQSVYAVTDKDGKALSRNVIDVTRHVAAAPVALIDYGLSQVARQGTARRLASELDFAVAGKTGTSDDLRDSWFAGFTGDMVSVIWMGYDDNSPTGLTGSSGAMRVWSRQFQNINTRAYAPGFPPDIEMVSIDRDSGFLGGAGCENNVELPFIKGSQPQRYAACAQQPSKGWLQELFGD